MNDVIPPAPATKPHWPDWCRRVGRGSQRWSAWLGVRVGAVLLGMVFLFVVTPLGWCLRLGRHDPLGLRRTAREGSYWRAARPYSRLDRMY